MQTSGAIGMFKPNMVTLYEYKFKFKSGHSFMKTANNLCSQQINKVAKWTPENFQFMNMLYLKLLHIVLLNQSINFN